jgi:streptogramin lyase
MLTVSLGLLLLSSAARAAGPMSAEHGVGNSAGIHPNGIAAGPDGNLWFTEPHRIGKITPAGAISEYSAGISARSFPNEIAAGPDGNLWFTEYNDRIGKITPTGVVTEYSAGISAGSHPNEIAAGPDGNLWFTESDGDTIGKITPAGAISEYGYDILADSNPYGIAAGPDGNLWFTESDGGRIGKMTPAGVISEYSPSSYPYGIAAGPDGNLWFTEPTLGGIGPKITSYGGIGKITPAGAITEYSAGISVDSFPAGIAAGPDGNLWFTEILGDRIGKITPTGVVTEYSAGMAGDPVPAAGEITAPDNRPLEIAAGPDGNVWFTEELTQKPGFGRIGKITRAGVVTEYPNIAVTVAVKGRGRVVGRPISCPARCKARIGWEATFRLRAHAARGYRFTGWRGACTGRRSCVLQSKAAVSVTAVFRKRRS